MSEGRDLWRSCGHHLLDRDRDGRLLVTDEFLKACLARPELVPPPEACPPERRLHGALLIDPWRPVSSSQISAIAAADARENRALMIAWRDHLARHGTLEAAYLDIVSGLGRLPPSPLVSLLGLSTATELDVLNDANADSYWERSDLFDIGLDLTAGRRGLAVLGDVVARWIAHLPAIDVAVEPLTELCNVPMRYLIVAMTADNALRLKPQNLVTGLPVRSAEAVN